MTVSQSQSAEESSHSRRSFLAAAGAVAGFSGVLYALTTGIRKVRPVPPPLGHRRYMRLAMTLADQTSSLTDAQRAEIRGLVQGRVIDRLGPGDFAAGYQIGPVPWGYDEVQHRIFGDWKEPLPEARPEHVDAVSVDEGSNQELRESWRATDARLREWEGRVAGIRAPGNSSCYLPALTYFETRFTSPEVSERWLFILGDLCEDPAPGDFEPVPPEAGRESVFESVKVVVARPFHVRGRHSRTEVDAFFGKYLADRGATDVEFCGLTDFRGLPENRVHRPQE